MGKLYTLACVITAMMLGAVLATAGYFFQRLVGDAPVWGDISPTGAWLVGLVALAYACSDAGLIPLPRPILLEAAQVTWWRAWRPYGAAIAYGAALGLGVTTRIVFGAFRWCCLIPYRDHWSEAPVVRAPQALFKEAGACGSR